MMQGWLHKKSRDLAFGADIFQRRFVILTSDALLYFHEEPSEDLMFVKGTENPLSHHSIDIDRIGSIEIVGKNKRKFRMTIRNPDVKGHASEHYEELVFRANDSAECDEWVAALDVTLNSKKK
jgi:hypothetical protein